MSHADDHDPHADGSTCCCGADVPSAARTLETTLRRRTMLHFGSALAIRVPAWFRAPLWLAPLGIATACTRTQPSQQLGSVVWVGSESAVRKQLGDTTQVYVPEARAYLTTPGLDAGVALSQKCPHLGCKIPFCDSSQRWECPCHGSKFNLAGEKVAGPAPAGMFRSPLVLQNGRVGIDMSSVLPGTTADPDIVDTPAGPACVGTNETH